MTRRRPDRHPDTPTARPAVERRDETADRRDDAKRRKLEMILDRFWRPARWAARASHAVGMQGGSPIHVDRRTLRIARPAGASPLRIAFASDFHAGATTDERVLAETCARLNDERPDLLLLGGDFVSVRANDIHRLADMLAPIHAPLGKFGVFGNHDLRANRAELASALTAAGVRMLVNEVASLPAPHADVSIVGLDDPLRGRADGTLLDTVDGISILLMHAPDGLLAAGDRHFDLALCGHTHGGQIVLPGGAIPYLPYGALSRAYPAGVFQLGKGSDRTLIVTRGVGCSTIPVRIGARTEIHVITVESSGSV
jgi:predicted MPP superfamily phosphohydrolase